MGVCGVLYIVPDMVPQQRETSKQWKFRGAMAAPLPSRKVEVALRVIVPLPGNESLSSAHVSFLLTPPFYIVVSVSSFIPPPSFSFPLS